MKTEELLVALEHVIGQPIDLGVLNTILDTLTKIALSEASKEQEQADGETGVYYANHRDRTHAWRNHAIRLQIIKLFNMLEPASLEVAYWARYEHRTKD